MVDQKDTGKKQSEQKSEDASKNLKEEFMVHLKEQSDERIRMLHRLGKKIWDTNHWHIIDLQNKCLDVWDKIGLDLDTKIIPLIRISEDRPVTNLIFGSGSFSTGEFQIKQYEKVKEYVSKPPVILQGLIANKNEKHQCNASKLSKSYNVPLVELDFIEWYQNNINNKEQNPIQSTRYWFLKDDPNRPPLNELERRFKIRQDKYHKVLGELIQKLSPFPTDIVSARGYSFQFCRNIFKTQNKAPHINDTHPADLTFVDPKKKERLYPGWQSGAVDLMIANHHTQFRGSLIEVDYMDQLAQAESLDEGSLLSIGEGVSPSASMEMSAKEIQEAMKIIDDYFFCTLEPTGLILTWGISEKPLWVTYQDLQGKNVQIKQRVIFVGNKMRSGVNAWGKDLKKDLKELEEFLF